ncbi:MAG: enolase C-terminal domain-like protein [Geminicoccaceae bacterium]
MIEIHGRLGASDAVRFIRKLDGFNVLWCEEPVALQSIELLHEAKARTSLG